MRGEWSEDSAAGAGAIDLIGLGRALAARKAWVIVPTILAFALSLAFVTLVHPRYTGVAKVLLENQESYYTRPDKAGPEQAPALDPEAVQSVAEGVTSVDMAQKAIRVLNLDSNEEFNPAQSLSPLSAVLTLLGVGRSTRPGDGRVVDTFLSHLSAFPVAKTRVLQIEFTSRDPALAARGANEVARLFLETQEDAKRASAKSASAWLASRIDELRVKVAEADARVETYRAEAGLLAGANNVTVNGQQLSDLTAQLATARATAADAQTKATVMRALVREGRATDELDHVHDDTLRRLGEQRNALRAQIALEAQTLLPGHPRMRELNAQLAELQAQIRVAAEKAARTLENESRLATAEVTSLEATLAAQSKTVAAANIDDVKLRALQLDSRAARDQLESYIQKYREAAARDADNSSPADARIIASASEPRSPTYPKKLDTLLLGTIAGLVLSVAAVVSQALLSGAAMVATPTRTFSAPAVAAAAPASAGDDVEDEIADDAILERPQPEDRTRFESADATARFIARQDDGGGVTLVAGVDSFADALEIGRALAGSFSAVLVSLAPLAYDEGVMIGHPGAEDDTLGLAEIVAGSATFEEVLFRDSASPLDVIMAGAAAFDPQGLHEALDAVRMSYDHVVVFARHWTDEASLAAALTARRLVLVAPDARLDGAMRRVAGAMRGLDLDIIGLSSGESDAPAVEAA